MAFSIHVIKFADEGEFIVYEYGSTDKKSLKLKINKNNGDIHIPDQQKMTKMTLRLCSDEILDWKQSKLPDKTCWAS